ncbi:hypothetical protein Ami103574_13520 [Aminipila butyrica]|uniref:SGNH hydrolase-type esterase domain-containing protein n=1 Tax=Aminipila butyrica TaxID=433296 RepID=A0A858BYR2_9FIRM|nr:GDSL-type esterase/lipase family protein [Aminipila butyrica]QIB70248.1 hypothetical protein Ami103574_13520 [Aminipila butyrica]
MVKITNKRRFQLFLMISFILLILFVFCGVWAMTAYFKTTMNEQDSSGNLTVGQSSEKEQVDNSTADPSNSDQKKEEVEGEKEGKGANHSPESTPESDSGSPVVQGTSDGSKTVVVPEELSPDQLYAAYNDTLIIGDSRVEGFKLYSGVKNASYFCMKAMTIDKIVEGKQVTISGQAVSVYDMLEKASYKKVIVGVGLNELGWNHIETFLADYGQLIDEIRQRQPEATIYLQAVLPVSKAKNDSDKVHNNAQVYWYNENIIKLAQDKGVQFVNPAAALVNQEGYLIPESTTDGVHLNAAYCKVWAECLAGLI